MKKLFLGNPQKFKLNLTHLNIKITIKQNLKE